MTDQKTKTGATAKLKILSAATQLSGIPQLSLHKITACPNGYVAFSLVPSEIAEAGRVHPSDPAIVTVMDADPERAMARAISRSLEQVEQVEMPLMSFLEPAYR